MPGMPGPSAYGIFSFLQREASHFLRITMSHWHEQDMNDVEQWTRKLQVMATRIDRIKYFLEDKIFASDMSVLEPRASIRNGLASLQCSSDRDPGFGIFLSMQALKNELRRDLIKFPILFRGPAMITML